MRRRVSGLRPPRGLTSLEKALGGVKVKNAWFDLGDRTNKKLCWSFGSPPRVFCV